MMHHNFVGLLLIFFLGDPENWVELARTPIFPDPKLIVEH